MNHFNDQHLASLLSSGFLNGQWIGVYYREESNRLYVFDSVESIAMSGLNCLNISVSINREPLEIKSDKFQITPFGLVVFWEGASWLWKEKWCGDSYSSHNGGHASDLIVR